MVGCSNDNELRQEIHKLSKENAELSSEINELSQSNDTLHSQINYLQQEIHKLSNENAELGSEINELSQSNDALHSQINELISATKSEMGRNDRREIITYELIEEYDKEKFSKVVKSYISKGYQPYGSHHSTKSGGDLSSIYHYQAMIKYKKD